MNEKKNLAIVFGATGNMAFAVASVLMDLKKYSPNLADNIIIYHDNITENDQKLINDVLPSKFIKYDFPIKDLSKFNQNYFNQFTSLAYSRYECFNLLNEYKTVIWLDIDILIQGDISGLVEYGNEKLGILPGGKLKEYLLKPIPGYNIEKQAYGTGTIVFTDKLPHYQELTQWCYEKTYEYAEYVSLPDQAVINLMLQHFNIGINGIDLDIYCCHPLNKAHKRTIIVHSYGPEKFWNFWSFKQWDNNYKNWLNKGGTPYKGKKAGLIKVLMKKLFPKAPDPLRKPRQFIIFMIKQLLGHEIQYGTTSKLPNKKAIVTIALGKKFEKIINKHCRKNWAKYAEKHGYDVIIINKPLDTSERAQKRSGSWQKCLILSQDWSNNYERIVWIDADILLNPDAPDIIEGVPLEKIGATNERHSPSKDLHILAVKRMYKFWKEMGFIPKNSVENEDKLLKNAGYYTEYGLPDDLTDIVQCGVLVLSPKHHKEVFEYVYNNYEDKEGFNYEMRPLSYEILTRNLHFWIDQRFNNLMHLVKAINYPFLLNKKGLPLLFKDKIMKVCLNTIFKNSYYLHFIGCTNEMKYINESEK